MIQWAALGLAASLLAGCERAGVDTPAPLQLSFRPVDIRPAQLNGVQLMGAHVLRSPHPQFGGFSGLSIRNGRIVAVSDAGWRLTGRIADGPGGLRARDMTFTALSDRDGAVFDKNGGDAESLSWRDEQLVVGFERDHRLMVMDANGRVTRALRDRRFERMTTNKGLEALATLPDGTLLAVGEAQRRGAFRMFRISPAGKVTQSSLPAVGPHLRRVPTSDRTGSSTFCCAITVRYWVSRSASNALPSGRMAGLTRAHAR